MVPFTWMELSKLHHIIQSALHYYTLYTDNTKKKSCFLCRYILLPGKIIFLVDLLKQAAENNNLKFDPREVQVYFEVMKSLEVVFPNASIKGCHFHYSQIYYAKFTQWRHFRFRFRKE